VDPTSLFTVDLAGDGLGSDPAAALAPLLERIGDQGRPRSVPRGADELGEARAELAAALVDFLRRPGAVRRRLLRRHEEQRHRAEAAERALREQRARLEELEQTATRLAALLDGTPDPEVDPAPLLRVNLAEESEIAADVARRRRFLSGSAARTPPAEPPTAGEGLAPEARIAAARLRIDALRLRFLALAPAERASLLERHRRGTTDEAEREAKARREEEARRAEQASLAELERARTLEVLRRAETEGARLAAEERMRLLSIGEALSDSEAELRKLRAESEKGREQALAWTRRLRELETRSVLDGDREADADRAYDRLVAELTAVRAALGSALDDLASGRSRIPVLPPPPDFPIEDAELARQRGDTAATAERLRSLDDGLRRERVSIERDAMASMNQVRLRLLPLTSPAKRESLSGFGPAGMRQGGREITQIGLEMRYHRHWLPRLLRARLEGARAAPLPEIVGLAELVALVLAFRWWRRRAEHLLHDLQTHFRSRRPPRSLDRVGWSLAWYLRLTRAPLEWLALVFVLARFPTVADLPELGYPLLVIAWALVGWFVMKLLDTVAARQGGAEGTGALRWRSLRLAGATVVGIGLLLSVAERSVGRGTLYSWISTAAWLVVVPVLVVLVAWWRPTVFARIRVREVRGPLLQWVLAHSEGVAGYAAAAVGGVWLLGEGVGRFVSRQTTELTAGQRLLAFLFRRELERQAAARVREGRFDPLTEKERQVLHPEKAGAERVESFGDEILARARELAARSGAVVAVVGERGLGKTTLLDRLLAGPGLEGAVHVAVGPGEFDTLLADLAGASGLAWDGSIVKLAEHLRELRPPVVCLDDVQRIMRPVIGGLADVDRLLNLARTVGPATTWMAAVGTPGYGYLERAREGRITFDEVLRLPPWTVEQITALVRARTREAGLDPSFDGLVVARPGDAMGGDTRRERTERDFYGLLWDSAGGNPAVALHLWSESLGRRPGNDEVVVRLADAPIADELENLPLNFFFVLRAVLQLELATEGTVALCTDLRQGDVADALRVARTRGLIEPAGERLRISLHWYRAVTQSLRRRHLLAF